MIVKVRVDPVSPEQGDGGGVSTTARTPPVARAAATSAMMTISLVLNDTTLMGSSRLSLKGSWPIWCGATLRSEEASIRRSCSKLWAVVYHDGVAGAVWVTLSAIKRIASGCRRAG